MFVPVTETAVPASACQSMQDVRGQIDRLDRALVGLIAERLTFIARAAELKQQRDAVHDPARIEDVVGKVRETAIGLGIDAGLVEQVWRVLIDRSIAREFALFDARQDGTAR